MSKSKDTYTGLYRFEHNDLNRLLSIVKSLGYVTMGPTLANGVLVLDEISTDKDFPKGLTDRQEPGKYRIRKNRRNPVFGVTHGPQGWKRLLHIPREMLLTGRRTEDSFELTPAIAAPTKYAFIGVRPCDLTAIQILDKVLLNGTFADPYYTLRREGLLIVAVNCTESSDVCFCASMNAGPEALTGYDIALTEVISGKEHYFVAKSGSETGDSILAQVPYSRVRDCDVEFVRRAIDNCAQKMSRSIDTAGIQELLASATDSPHWDRIASRCLTCSNCTLVCPTCFCTTIEDTTDLTGEHCERYRRWDSCMTLDFSYIHGGAVRTSAKSRYRQWMTHKLSTWVDQFGSFGCVGCGRCISWCPVGIDITEEAKIFQAGK